mmetsp:Transcript_3965/g.3385  ORF Transcript_3965/g.3385 Transcript_3965/m.3385 type:complete len:194 (+) Transcript_3965:190-771(+)
MSDSNEMTKERHQKQKDFHHKKQKEVPESGTHPLERHSGTGVPAYERKEKKGGAGKGNWGKAEDELNFIDLGVDEADANENQGSETGSIESKKMITMEEYLQLKKTSSYEPQSNPSKSKISSDDLWKGIDAEHGKVLKPKHLAEDGLEIKLPRKKSSHVKQSMSPKGSKNCNELLNLKTEETPKKKEEEAPKK